MALLDREVVQFAGVLLICFEQGHGGGERLLSRSGGLAVTSAPIYSPLFVPTARKERYARRVSGAARGREGGDWPPSLGFF